MCGVPLQLMFSNYCISPSHEGKGFISRWTRETTADLRARFVSTSRLPVQYPSPLHRESIVRRGGRRRFLSQDLNPGSDSAALRETKAGDDLTEKQGDGRRTEPPPAPQAGPHRGSPRCSAPRKQLWK